MIFAWIQAPDFLLHVTQLGPPVTFFLHLPHLTQENLSVHPCYQSLTLAVKH